MINRIIEFSARNPLSSCSLWRGGGDGRVEHVPPAAGCRAGLERHAGHHLFALGPQPGHPGGPGHLPHRQRHAGRAEGKSRARFSDFGYSFVYVIFEDGTDIYWARTRTLEYLSSVLSKLPQGVNTELGPDATGLGWVYQYVLTDTSGQRSLADLRSLQDWYLRYYLKAVPGVAEVAPVAASASSTR